MRIMAKGTVFRNRCMFPQKWATFLGVAGVAGIVDCRAGQEKVVGAIVRIVTIGTGHLTKSKWMATGPESFRAGTGMACKTFFLLSQLIHYRIPLCVHLVTTGAGNLFLIVHTAYPMDHVAVTMTGKAYFILRTGRGSSSERNLWGQTCAIFLFLSVRRTWTVTGFTIVGTISKWRFFCATDTHRSQENLVCCRILAFTMTGHALPGAL